MQWQLLYYSSVVTGVNIFSAAVSSVTSSFVDAAAASSTCCNYMPEFNKFSKTIIIRICLILFNLILVHSMNHIYSSTVTSVNYINLLQFSQTQWIEWIYLHVCAGFYWITVLFKLTMIITKIRNNQKKQITVFL